MPFRLLLPFAPPKTKRLHPDVQSAATPTETETQRRAPFGRQRKAETIKLLCECAAQSSRLSGFSAAVWMWSRCLSPFLPQIKRGKSNSLNVARLRGRRRRRGSLKKKRLIVRMTLQWIQAWSYRGQLPRAPEQLVSEGDDVRGAGYITRAEHFISHSNNVEECDMNARQDWRVMSNILELHWSVRRAGADLPSHWWKKRGVTHQDLQTVRREWWRPDRMLWIKLLSAVGLTIAWPRPLRLV